MSAGSVTNWLQALQVGDPEAAQKLWERYFQRLVSLARSRLRGAPRRAEDEEDVALSAFTASAAAPGRGTSRGWPTATTSGVCWWSSPPARPATSASVRAGRRAAQRPTLWGMRSSRSWG